MEYVYEFGFVICYLEDKIDIIEYVYELWYLCYVGNLYVIYLYKYYLILEEVMEDKK